MWKNIEELGLSYMASVSREKGHHVILVEKIYETISLEFLNEPAPDVIVLSLYNINKAQTYDICARIKEINLQSIIVVGGAFPTYYGSICTNHAVNILQESDAIDIVVKGEAERTFNELLDAIDKKDDLRGIKGIAYKDGQTIIESKDRSLTDLNDLPDPARDILIQNCLPYAQISGSRGCTANCSFCAYKSYWPKWRGRNISNILDEIQHLMSEYGILAFNFIDGSFEDPGYNEERLIQFATEVLERKMLFSYYIQLRAESYEKITDKVITLLVESGLSNICLGIESGNEEDLLLYGKKSSLKQMRGALQFFKQHELNVDPGFINFNAYSTPDRLKQNVLFMKQYGYASNLDYLIKKTFVFSGTSLYEIYKKDGLLYATDWSSNDFRFVNPNVAKLYKYLTEFLLDPKEGGNLVFRKICHGSSTNMVYISCLQSLFRRSGDETGYQITCEYKTAMNLVREDINNRISDWMIELIDLADNNWSAKEAYKISLKHNIKNFLKQCVVGYNYYQIKMLGRFNKISLSRDIEKFINKVF